MTVDRNSVGREEGYVLSQDIVVRPKSSPFDLALRYAMFDTDSYDTRIYTFENNALYVFSAPAYYYQGSRAYFLVRYSFLHHCDLWFRLGTYLYSNKTVLSSGAEQINGNQKTDVTVQFRMTF